MIGTKLADRYEIASELGRGGMGVVYRAHDPRLSRDVAVKCVPPSQLGADAEHRFQREAQLVAQMDHPAIVPIHDFGRHEGMLFFVMPLVQGTNLRAFLRQEEARLGEVLDVGIQVAEALEYSHARGVVHRDVKPENVMVSRDEGASVRVRVMDFGLARASTESRLTRTGTLVGTLAYLSPEQVAAREVDGRSDVYALGTVLYECVAGAPPFAGEAQSVLYRIVHEFPRAPRDAGAEIDEELERIVLSCLAKEPHRRPRAGELAEALKSYRARLHASVRERAVAGLTQTTMQAPRPAQAAPLVGRKAELAELQKRLNAALDGECQLVVVSGEPGAGKTRLLDEIESLARARGIRALHGRSVERDRAFAYQGFCDAIQEYFRYRDSASSSAPDFSDLAPELLALFPMLHEIPEIRDAAGASASVPRAASPPAENQTQVFELLARTLTRIAGGKPLLLVMEDLHAAEVSLDALQYVVRRLGPTPTLILGSYRTSEVDKRHPLTRLLEGFRGDRRFAAVPLAPLTPAEHREFVETLVGGAGLNDSLAQRLFESTEGNPFFTKELVRSLLGSGAISTDATGQWSLSGEAALTAEAMPATIQEAIEARIQRLPDDLRQLLATAAVMGRSFDARDLASLAEADVDDALDRLLVEGYLEEQREARGDVLAFSSGVVRDVLYASLSPRKRRSLHRRCAELLESRHAGRLERVLPQLVHHFFNGDVPEKTVEHGLRLAASSLDAFSAEEAARAAKVALSFLDDEWEGDRGVEADARLMLARALRMAGDTEGALRETQAAVGILERLGRGADAAAALLLAAETAWQARRSEEAGRFAERGLQAAQKAGDTGVLRSLLPLAARLANMRGDYERAKALIAADEDRGGHEREAAADLPLGGRLVVALANPVGAIEPGRIQTNEEAEVAANVFESLVRAGDDGVLSPGLCERWELREEGRAFRLPLRREVLFSDGHPLVADDVKVSFETAVRNAVEEIPAGLAAIRGAAEFRAGAADRIEGIVVRGPHELEVRLTEPLPIYPALLTYVSVGIVRVVDGQPIGTGPFRIVSREAGRIVMERNERYWREPRPALDALEFRIFETAHTIEDAFRRGEVDLARDLLPQELEEILRQPAHRRGLVEAAKRNTYFVLFNASAGPAASSPALRRALSGVTRPQDLVWRALGRFAEPASCLIPPSMLGHDPGRRNPSLSLDEARALLREKGVATPLKLRAAVHPLLRDRYGALLTALFRLWSELGVEVAIENADMAAYVRAWDENAGLDLVVGRWNADYDDPDNFTHSLFNSRTGLLRGWFCSPEADRLLEDARKETRAAAREALYRRFEALLAQAGALVPLFHDIDYRLAGPRVRGANLRGVTPYIDYRRIGKAAEPVEAEPDVRAAGGTLHIPCAGVVTRLDPCLTSTLDEAEVIPLVFETLTRDAGGAAVVSWLAAEFTPEEGGRQYRFRLREGVRFSDGRRVTARDVRYSFERLLRGEGDTRFFFDVIRGARAVLAGESEHLTGFHIHSAGEFTIELEAPMAFFPALISYPSAAIVPEGADLAGTPTSWIGTGPYRLAAFEPGKRLVLEPNRAYWRKGYPRNEGLTFSFGVPPEETLAGFRSGRFAVASDLYPADVEALRHEPRFMAGHRETPRLMSYFAVFNTRRGPLADRALRLRVAAAVDVPRLVRQHLGRRGIPAVGLIPPGLLGHESTAAPRERVAAAEAPAPVELAAAVHPVFLSNYASLARDLASAFAEAGVRLRVVNRTMEEYEAAIENASVDVAVGRWGADYPDADTFVYILHSTSGFVGRLCGSEETDRLAEGGRAETAPARRHAIYRQVEEAIAREALLLPLFHEQTYRFAQPDVAGLAVSFGIPVVAYEELHLHV
jgi:ABC-type transport system substrate-binding protein